MNNGIISAELQTTTGNVILSDTVLNGTATCTVPGKWDTSSPFNSGTSIGAASIYYSPIYVPTNYSNQLVIEKVENGFTLKYESKMYVAISNEGLNKLINKLLTKENK